MNKNSPFQDWLDANTQGYAFSQDILMWMAKAYEGGQGNPKGMHPQIVKAFEDYFDKAYKQLEPLKRDWAGLTFDDETECLAAGNTHTHGWKGVMKKTEEKLKEKNHAL